MRALRRTISIRRIAAPSLASSAMRSRAFASCSISSSVPTPGSVQLYQDSSCSLPLSDSATPLIVGQCLNAPISGIQGASLSSLPVCGDYGPLFSLFPMCQTVRTNSRLIGGLWGVALPLPLPMLFKCNSLCHVMDACLNAVINSGPNWCKTLH